MTVGKGNTMLARMADNRSLIILIGTMTALLGKPAWGKDFCSVPKSQWRPQSALVQKLESQGWKIRNMKIDGGCYEVYGTDGQGKARETHFDPATFKAVAEKHR
ncbi:MAG: PepSY domain-containing protein [Hyphomicrobium sp.]